MVNSARNDDSILCCGETLRTGVSHSLTRIIATRENRDYRSRPRMKQQRQEVVCVVLDRQALVTKVDMSVIIDPESVAGFCKFRNSQMPKNLLIEIFEGGFTICEQ